VVEDVNWTFQICKKQSLVVKRKIGVFYLSLFIHGNYFCYTYIPINCSEEAKRSIFVLSFSFLPLVLVSSSILFWIYEDLMFGCAEQLTYFSFPLFSFFVFGFVFSSFFLGGGWFEQVILWECVVSHILSLCFPNFYYLRWDEMGTGLDSALFPSFFMCKGHLCLFRFGYLRRYGHCNLGSGWGICFK